MQLFIDECLSHTLAHQLNESGAHVAQHPLLFGGRGEADHTVLGRCIRDDLVIVTQNARDFCALVSTQEIHPGLITLPATGKKASRELLFAAIAYLESQGDPMRIMVNHVLEVESLDVMTLYELPVSD